MQLYGLGSTLRAKSASPLIGLVAAFGAANSGLCAETYAYDALGRVILLSSDNNHQTVYSYDAAGNRTSVNVTTPANLQAPTVSNRTYSYTYGSGPQTFNPTSLTVTGISVPVFGTVTLSGSTITYTAPTTNAVVTDSFTYSAQNAQGLTDSGLILVNLTNAAPQANADTFSFIYGSAASTAFNPLANDTVQAGLGLTITGVSGNPKGVVTNNGATVTYTPPADHSVTSDSFGYAITDGAGGISSSTITVNLSNSAPVANPDSITVSAGGYTTLNPLANDTDASGNALSVTGVGPAPAHGALSYTSNTATYTASAGYAGSDSFTYTASDAYGGSAQGVVSVSVTTTANHAPVANPISIDVGQNTSAFVDVCGSSPPYATDQDGDALTVSVPAIGMGSVTASGCSFTYNAPVSANGFTTGFNYTVTDTHGATASAHVSVTVEGHE